MKYQVFETFVIKPYVGAYEAAQKQLKQYLQMNVFSERAITNAELKLGKFDEGSIYFNYEEGADRKSIRVIPYMNKNAMHAFKHPIYIDTKDNSTVVVFNANPYGNMGSDGIISIRQSSMDQFNFMLSMSLIIGLAQAGRLTRDDIVSMGKIPVYAYSICLSQALAKYFSLDYIVQLKVQALSCYFYYHALLGLDHEVSVDHTAIVVKLDKNLIEDLLSHSDVQQATELNDLAAVIAKHSGSERLMDFNVTVLLTAIKQYWSGDNAAETICMAYEMPHVWSLLCLSSMEHILYKRNQLAEIMKIASKTQDSKHFSYSMKKLLTQEV